MKLFYSSGLSAIAIVAAVALIIAGAAGGYFFFFAEEEPAFETVAAERGKITREVSVTGKVSAAKEAELAFEESGRIASVAVKAGDKVAAGRVLARLQSGDAAARLAEARANLQSQAAKLEELKKGTRPEEVAVAETKSAGARDSLEDAKKNLLDKLRDAYTKSDDAIRAKTDKFFNNAKSSSPQLVFPLSDYQLKNDLEWRRMLLEKTLTSWEASTASLSLSEDLRPRVVVADANLNEVKSFLEKSASALSSLGTSSTLSQTTVDGYRSDVSTARTNVNTAISNLLAADEKLRTAESSLALAESELALKKAGATTEQIASQEALVAQAEAQVEQARVRLAKTAVVSPFAGMVTRVDAKAGEMAAANSPLIFIISEAEFEIEANISETDIAKVNAGDPARVTLDAYGSDVVFEAVVTAIDPAETVIEGVSTYRTILQFAEEDGRLKSGMTANIDILAEEKDGVVAVPERAVISKNGNKSVRILIGGEAKEASVETGLRGSDGNVEIVSGINEGDAVIVSSLKK